MTQTPCHRKKNVSVQWLSFLHPSCVPLRLPLVSPPSYHYWRTNPIFIPQYFAALHSWTTHRLSIINLPNHYYWKKNLFFRLYFFAPQDPNLTRIPNLIPKGYFQSPAPSQPAVFYFFLGRAPFAKSVGQNPVQLLGTTVRSYFFRLAAISFCIYIAWSIVLVSWLQKQIAESPLPLRMLRIRRRMNILHRYELTHRRQNPSCKTCATALSLSRIRLWNLIGSFESFHRAWPD